MPIGPTMLTGVIKSVQVTTADQCSWHRKLNKRWIHSTAKLLKRVAYFCLTEYKGTSANISNGTYVFNHDR